MPVQSESFDVAVVGGGAIGLACAWRARSAARASIVIDAGEPGAWHVAAGMLAPVSEAEFGERALLRAGPGERAPLRRTSAPSSTTRATARAARWSSRATATRPRRSTASPPSGATSACRSSGCARRRRAASSPRSAPTIRLALDIEGDHAIDPRKLVAALARAFAGEQRRGAGDAACASRGERVTGVELADGATISAGAVVVAAGVHVAQPGDARARPRARCARSRARCCGCATPRPRPRRAHDPRRAGVLRPARRRALRARRDDGGARLGHDADRGRRLRAAARPERARPRHLRARDRGAAPRGCGRRRRTTCPRSATARSTGLVWATGHFRNGILLTPGHGRPRRRGAEPASRCRISPRGRSAPLRRSARMKVLLNGETAEFDDGATVKTALGGARPAGRGPRRRGRGRRRGRPARAVGGDAIARRGAGGDPARDPGRLRWPSPTRTPTS